MTFAGQRNIEDLETLAGRRSGAIDQAAVRYRDLATLLELLPELRSTTVTAAPTQDQFNALVADLQDIHQALKTVSDALRAQALRR